MKNKFKRIYNKPSNVTYTRTYYGIKQYHTCNLKKVYIWNGVKITLSSWNRSLTVWIMSLSSYHYMYATGSAVTEPHAERYLSHTLTN